WRDVVTAGGLLSYGPDLADIVRRAAPYVDRVLHGEKPADLPVQVPTKFEVAVNVKTARALGLDVPASILVSADQVIEKPVVSLPEQSERRARLAGHSAGDGAGRSRSLSAIVIAGGNREAKSDMENVTGMIGVDK